MARVNRIISNYYHDEYVFISTINKMIQKTGKWIKYTRKYNGTVDKSSPNLFIDKLMKGSISSCIIFYYNYKERNVSSLFNFFIPFYDGFYIYLFTVINLHRHTFALVCIPSERIRRRIKSLSYKMNSIENEIAQLLKTAVFEILSLATIV